MDEKELTKRIKNSLKAKKSKAEIMSGFQKRGYKLEYAEKLITKVKRPKRMVIIFLIAIVLFFSITFSTYTIFSNQEKHQIINPLSGFSFINTSQSLQIQDIDLLRKNIPINQGEYDQIEITPEFISFILNEIGAWKLHNHPITFKIPIINFRIDSEEFHSEIDGEIKTYKGFNKNADLQFNTNKKDVVNVILSDDPEEVFIESIVSGRTQIEVKTSESELFAKGYLKLYNSLK